MRRRLVVVAAVACAVAALGAAARAERCLPQFTPHQANWTGFDEKTFGSGTNTAHDPDGVGWISRDAWREAEWDGTVYNPSTMSKGDFVKAICPSVDRVRGIREVFYAYKPFADNRNPTKAEIDDWHRVALNHVRALVGYTSPERQASADVCMHARALWGDERKFTTKWDDAYPGTTGSAAGPCQGSGNAHCGATFVPSAEDQAPYLPADWPTCRTVAGAEGVFGGPKADIPWSIKWSRGLCNTLHAEGFWGGHVGPWFHREKFGFSFWPSGKHAVLRAKWTGKLMPNLYCKPGDDSCDPAAAGPPADAPAAATNIKPIDDATCTELAAAVARARQLPSPSSSALLLAPSQWWLAVAGVVASWLALALL